MRWSDHDLAVLAVEGKAMLVLSHAARLRRAGGPTRLLSRRRPRFALHWTLKQAIHRTITTVGCEDTRAGVMGQLRLSLILLLLCP